MSYNNHNTLGNDLTNTHTPANADKSPSLVDHSLRLDSMNESNQSEYGKNNNRKVEKIDERILNLN